MAYLDAVKDADHVGDMQDSLLARQIDEIERFTKNTRQAFASAFRGEMTCVEWVHYPFMNGPTRIKTQPTREAFSDEMQYTEAENAFWLMLQKSECPHVTAFKKLIEDNFINRWAEQIGEFRSGT